MLNGTSSRLSGGVLTPSPSGGTSDALTIASIVKSTYQPTANLDLVGNGSGEVGVTCPITAVSTSAAAAGVTQPCQCNYSYLRSTGSTEAIAVDPIYSEPNLLRCPYSQIPADVSSVQVKVAVISQGVESYSNTITITLSGGGGSSLSLTDPSSFIQPTRYQCRDAIIIPTTFASAAGTDPLTSIYDPIISEDPRYSYPLNFYSSNLYAAAGGLISALDLVNTQGKGWFCPTSPNSSVAGIDLNVYSQGADLSGSLRIFPASGSAFDRSTFFLARRAAGIFNVPVHAIVAPPGVTSVDPADPVVGPTDGSPGPLGYGVAANRLSDGTETCPDTSVPIPLGFHWVKVWQFRGTLDPRSFPRSQRLAQTAISCNPGPFPTGPAIPVCGGNAQTLALADDSVLADRVVASQGANQAASISTACMNLQHGSFASGPTACNDPVNGPGSGAGCTTTSSGNKKSLYTLYAKGSDIWRWVRADVSTPTVPGGGYGTTCSGSFPNDFLNLCTQPDTAAVPYDNNVQWNVETAGKYDYLLVVSPTSIQTKDMTDASSSTALPYLPYRFYPGGCTTGDPSAPAFSGDCAPVNRINYSFKAFDARTQGDAPTGDPGRTPVFPVCALQPN
jgi:hypothetical protein